MSLNVLLWVLHWPEAGNFIKKESLAQVFSCEFCEISKSTYFYRTPLVAASGDYHKNLLIKLSENKNVYAVIHYTLCNYSVFCLTVFHVNTDVFTEEHV